MDSIQEQFNHIQNRLSDFSRQLGGIAATLERDSEDRNEFRRALGDFRDDITDLRQLGPKTHEAIQRVIKNESRLESIERWRNQAIGARRATHAMAGAAGGILTFLAEWTYHFFTATHR